MSVSNLMRHSVDLYRPYFKPATTAQEIQGYNLVASAIPSFIQPASSQEEFYYAQRGIENVHNVYTSDTDTVFLRNDVLEWNARQFQVIGTQNGCEMNFYQVLTCYEYPEGAKKRLTPEEYP